MEWTVQWEADEVGVVVHSGGATFRVTPAGGIAVDCAAGHSQPELLTLIQELRHVMAMTWPHRMPARLRLH